MIEILRVGEILVRERRVSVRRYIASASTSYLYRCTRDDNQQNTAPEYTTIIGLTSLTNAYTAALKWHV